MTFGRIHPRSMPGLWLRRTRRPGILYEERTQFLQACDPVLISIGCFEEDIAIPSPTALHAKMMARL
ncbi:hypothetical protein HW555_014425 [Spodoptera exigua]|uniref:Uncharacterized protein n=1 Tax=Spodoptera exigua TaxID=7107 RepID=A0A835G2Q6_SPOEX|nr:hypothetical protein HW555_014425 [Spodoptera exigua]